MSSSAKVFDDALSLPESERARLAARLIESLDPVCEAGVDEAWRAEVARRIRESDDGTVKAVDWSEARRLILG